MDKLAADVSTAVTDIKDLLAQIAANSGDQAKVDALTAAACVHFHVSRNKLAPMRLTDAQISANRGG